MGVELIDLTQPWSSSTPPWPTGEAPVVKRVNTLATDGFNQQKIETENHVGTHIDGPMHFDSSGRDIASLPLNGKLFGDGAVANISDSVGEYDIYTPEHITEKVEVKKGDILIINTGFHKYSWDSKTADEIAYFCKHPGPHEEFKEWAMDMELKWIGVDCGSADHPMNTLISKLHPGLAKEFEQKHGKPVKEVFPPEMDHMMHNEPFKKQELIHVENLAGDIDKVSNERLKIGCFPIRFVGGESSLCRVVAFRGI